MADQQGNNGKNVDGGATDGGQPPLSKADAGKSLVAESPVPPAKMAKLDPKTGKLDNADADADADVDDDEEAEYEEYEVDEDEEIEEEEEEEQEQEQEPEVVKKPQPQPARVVVKNQAAVVAALSSSSSSSANVLNPPVAGPVGQGKVPVVQGKVPVVAGNAPASAKAPPAAAKNPPPIDDDEDEEYVENEEEDEEVEYEDEEEPDPMKDKIHELLNKATSLKQDSQQSKLSNESKLTSILPQAAPTMMAAAASNNQALAQASAQAAGGVGGTGVPLQQPSGGTGVPPLQQPARADQAILANVAKRPFVGESAGTLPKTMLMMKSEQPQPQQQQPQQQQKQQQSGVQLSPMRHCSNKWDMTNLNEDDEQGAKRPITLVAAAAAAAALDDSDDGDDHDHDHDDHEHRNAGEDTVIENPILRQKLDIHRAVMAEQNRSMYDPHDSEEGEDQIGEIEVAFENHFIDSSEEEGEYGVPKQLDRAILDIQLVAASMGFFTDDDESMSHPEHPVRPISSYMPPNVVTRTKHPDGIVDFGNESTVNFAREFVKGVVDKASAEAAREPSSAPSSSSSLAATGPANLNAAAAAAAGTSQESGSNGGGSKMDFNARANPMEMVDVKRELSILAKIKKEEEEAKARRAAEQQRIFGGRGVGFGGGVGAVGEDPYAIVPELLPNIQTTDLSKKYSIDLTHVDPRVFPTAAQTTVAPMAVGGRLIGPSSAYYHQQRQQPQDFLEPLDQLDQNDQTEPQDGTWQTVMKHIIIAFIIYLGFKFVFGLIV